MYVSILPACITLRAGVSAAELNTYQTLTHPQSCGVPVRSNPQYDVPTSTSQTQSYSGAVSHDATVCRLPCCCDNPGCLSAAGKQSPSL